jgi:hypothetical protein
MHVCVVLAVYTYMSLLICHGTQIISMVPGCPSPCPRLSSRPHPSRARLILTTFLAELKDRKGKKKKTLARMGRAISLGVGFLLGCPEVSSCASCTCRLFHHRRVCQYQAGSYKLCVCAHARQARDQVAFSTQTLGTGVEWVPPWRYYLLTFSSPFFSFPFSHLFF